MHRELFDLSARIERALAQRITPAVYSHRTAVQLAAHQLPGEPVSFDEAATGPFQPIEVGADWGRPWGTTWFRVTGTVPEPIRHRSVELVVDLGFGPGGPGFRSEALAYTSDGTIIKGVEPRTAYVPVDERTTRTDGSFEIYLEAASNPRFDGTVSALGDWHTAGEQPLYRLERAEVAALEEEVLHLRVESQLLHQLAHTLPGEDPRHHELLRTLELMVDELDEAGITPEAIVAAAPSARAHLADALAAPARASAHRISAAGHAHIDSAWLWPVRETIRKCTRTFANVLDLAGQYPELVFACSSAQQYDWIREHQPRLWDRLRESVQAGQFVPVGGMWVESDTNMPGGEALVRQFAAGKRFFAEHLGCEPAEVWLPDSFGYTAALPQLARLAGFRWLLSQKMSWNATNDFPHHTFWWEGIDGTRIFTHFPPADTYSSELSGRELARAQGNFRENGRATRSLLPFGYGDGGGGPTREMLLTARLLHDLEGAPRVEVEAPESFFTAAEEEYGELAPVWSGEMYLEFHRGIYTSQRAMKEGNRRAEHRLHEAELWATTATVLTGAEYPGDELRRLWHAVLLLQFHDILPGSSIAWVHREARQTYTQILDALEELIDTALTALSGNGSIPLEFNATPHPHRGVPAYGAGQALPESGTVRIVQGADGVTLDNGRLRVQVAPDGTLASVRDLAAEREVLGGPGNLLHLHPDTPNRFDAWDLDEFYRNRSHALTTVDHLEVDQSDPTRAVVRAHRTDGDSRFEQEIALASGSATVECCTRVDWQERERILKVAFGVDVHADRSTAEIQFGHVHRPTHTNTSWDAARFEVPAHRWLHVAEPGYGVALVNASSYGHEVTRPGPGQTTGAGATTLRLSLLRGPRYPDPETDLGRHELRYALVCGADIPDAIEAGYLAGRPARRRAGAAAIDPLVRASDGPVLLETIKLADDGSQDLVLRLYESRGGRGRTELTVADAVQMSAARVCDLLERDDDEAAALAPLHREGNTLLLDLEPFQVVTVRIAREGDR